MRVRVYVDGLNFHHNVAEEINFWWIDLERCLRQAIESHLRIDIEIEQIKFFSALVLGKSQKSRQVVYHDALQAHSPNIKITLGKFHKYIKTRELAFDYAGMKKGDLVKVIIQEEKQTDVNLAAAMIEDAYTPRARAKFDVMCLVTNDSDLWAALAINKKLNLRTILLTPLVEGHNFGKNPAKSLRNELLNPDKDLIKHFREDNIRQCPLPDVVAEQFAIPEEWRVG